MRSGKSTAVLPVLWLALLGCVEPPPAAPPGQITVEEAASRLEEASDELKQTSRRWAQVSAADFRHLDLAWYDQAAALLKKERYVQLGELADVDHNHKHWSARTFVRVLVAPDGASMAGLYHYWDTRRELRDNPLNDHRIIDFETEFSDGSFVVTTSAPSQADLDMGPKFDKSFTRTKDPVVLTRVHADHVAEYQAKHPELQPLAVRTLDDVIAAQQRMQQLKGAYRQEMGVPFSEDELNHITDYKLRDVVDAVSRELRRRFPSW